MVAALTVLLLSHDIQANEPMDTGRRNAAGETNLEVQQEHVDLSRHPVRQRGQLVGAWLAIDPPIRFPDGCEGDTGIYYKPDGTYETLEQSGTWRLDGDRLTETATHAHEAVEPGAVKIGQSFVSRIRWEGPDEFVKAFANDHSLVLRRCPITR